ncbi:MAG: peptidoglycan DD-metalloendopeptidase family protein [Oscillospiraceae bacterium]|nr:peptidoglycan DD-metalloendopeptidase family protein [Oscillospiraceae bacterium]
MSNKNFMKIAAAFSLSAVMTLSSFSYVPVTAFSPAEAEKSISELEELKTENKEHIAELQKEIEEYQSKYENVEADESVKLEYRNALTEKMELQSQNIDYVSGQISKLDDEIGENVEQINLIESQVKDTDEKIEGNVALLKKRIRVSYMSSGDSISSILFGSSSFYDMLAKFELIAKVAEHDKDLIKTLKEQINELKTLRTSLETTQAELTENLESEKEKKAEFTAALDALGEDYTATQEELDRLDGVKTEINESIVKSQKAIDEEEEELKKIASQVEEFERMIAAHSISVSESVSESESIAASEAESRAEESRRAAKSRREEESRRAAEEAKRAAEGSRRAAENNEKPTTQAPEVQTQPSTEPATEAPKQEEPVTPSAETQAPAPSSQPTYSSGFCWPVANGYGIIYSPYGTRGGAFHKGIDITASDSGTIMGKAIVAACDGIVFSVENTCPHNYGKSDSCRCGGGYGRYVVIKHNDGKYCTLYAHLSNAIVSVGQSVSQGETIGYAGSTGDSRGAHLHFEVRYWPFKWTQENTINPVQFVSEP